MRTINWGTMAQYSKPNSVAIARIDTMYYAIFDLDSGEFRVIDCGDFLAKRHEGLAVGSKEYCQEILVGASRCKTCGQWMLAANSDRGWPEIKDCKC